MRTLLVSLSLLLPGLVMAQGAPQFAEEIVVRVIDVDVVVTDRQGRPIAGLQREDFELLEDGKPVEIRYFTGVSEGKPASDSAVAAPAEVPAVAVSSEAAVPPVTWVVFIDGTHMHPSRRNRTLGHLRAFLQTSMTPSDQAIIASNDGLALRVKASLTKDRKLLLNTLSAMEKERVHQGVGTLRASQVRQELRDVDSFDRELNTILAVIKGQIEAVIQEEAQRTRNALRSMGALVDVLAGVEGRLALVYVGAGFNILPGQELVDTFRTRFPNEKAPDAEVHRHYLTNEVDRLYANLSATRVTVYTIHAGGLEGTSVEDPGVLMTFGVAPVDRTQSTQAGLAREMAQRTGGLYFAVNPGLVKQLTAVRSDLSHYYSLGYVPKGTQGDPRRVNVRVKLDGARVRHRETVRERTRSEEAERATVAALVQPRTSRAVKRVEPTTPPIAPTEANPLGVRVEPARPQRDGWSKDHLLPFDLQLGSITFMPKGSVHRAEFVMHFALVEPNGTIWPIESREHSLEIPAGEVPATPDEHVSFVWHVDLTPLRVPPEIPIKTGAMTLSVTVEDRGSKTRSVVTVPVQKPGQPYFPGDEKTSRQ